MRQHSDYRRIVPFYYEKRNGHLITAKEEIPIKVRRLKKEEKNLIFMVWEHPNTSIQKKKEISLLWSKLKVNFDGTEFTDKKKTLKFKPLYDPLENK